jgi:hypothetical protein
LLAKFGTNPERSAYAAVRTASYKTEGLGAPYLLTDTYTAAAKDTIIIPERILNVFHAAKHGNVLDGTGIRCLGHEQFRDISPQTPYF